MNLTQAKAALKKLYGDKAMWRYDERAPLTEERAAVEATIPDLKAKAEAAKAARDARYAEITKDPEYVRLRAEKEAALKALEEARSFCRHYRVTVGKVSLGGLAFHVIAQGDNWDEAIAGAQSAKT